VSLPNLVVDDTQAQRNALQIPPLLAPLPNLIGSLPVIVTGLGSFDPQGWASEETLDVEAVHATAPGARIIYQGADSDNNLDLTRAQNQVVENNQAQIITNSYGGNSDVSDPASDAIWQQAAAQGIGVYFASGDNGDETGGTGAAAQRQTDAGANSPYVTAVGGTTLGIKPHDKYGFETYWGVYSDPLSGGRYAQTPPGKFLYGGGGGTSEVYAEPSWQKGVVADKFASYWKGNPAAIQGATVPGRVVPDVAIDGDPQTGLEIGLTQDFDAYRNGQLGALATDGNVAYSEYRIGGTSLSSPLFAGLMALANQAAGKRLGFANPALYAAAARRAFHDIKPPAAPVAQVRTDYLNTTNPSGGIKQELRTTAQTVSLTSAVGFDDSTGLGSPRGLAFLHALAPGNKLVSKLLKKYHS
jgi:subtilase family serine protease